jgi:hypothetical protein
MADISAMHAAMGPRERGPIGRFEYRSALALAEAIIPGSRNLAAAGEMTVARAEEMTTAFHPALARAWRVSQATLAAIVDGSTVPGPPGVNPQLTIMAMATRAAEKIAELA